MGTPLICVLRGMWRQSLVTLFHYRNDGFFEHYYKEDPFSTGCVVAVRKWEISRNLEENQIEINLLFEVDQAWGLFDEENSDDEPLPLPQNVTIPGIGIPEFPSFAFVPHKIKSELVKQNKVSKFQVESFFPNSPAEIMWAPERFDMKEFQKKEHIVTTISRTLVKRRHKKCGVPSAVNSIGVPCCHQFVAEILDQMWDELALKFSDEIKKSVCNSVSESCMKSAMTDSEIRINLATKLAEISGVDYGVQVKG